MGKNEKFILITVFIILAFILNLVLCFKAGATLNTTYYFFFSLIPYFIYSSVIVSIKNKPVIYITAVFILIIDFLIKLNISVELIKCSDNVIYSWMLMSPLVLVSLIFIVFILFVTGVWFCKKRGITKFNLKFNIPEKFRFEDEELIKFLFIILSFGFLINFQNIIHVSTGIMNMILGIGNTGSSAESSLFQTIIAVALSMMPYFIFVLVSYFVNCRQISYIIGFAAIVFDIYLKIITYLFSNTGYTLGGSFTEILYSIFNPFTFIMFIPIAFAAFFFGRKIFDKNIINSDDNEGATENT